MHPNINYFPLYPNLCKKKLFGLLSSITINPKIIFDTMVCDLDTNVMQYCKILWPTVCSDVASSIAQIANGTEQDDFEQINSSDIQEWFGPYEDLSEIDLKERL